MMINRTIIVTANEGWNLINFRSGILKSLIERGFKVVAATPYNSDIADQLRRMGCAYEAVPIDASGLHPFRDIRTALAYRRLVAKHNPLAVLSWTIKPNIYATWPFAGGGGRSIPNVSGLGTAFMKRGPLRLLTSQMYRRALKNASTIFFQNVDDLNLFVEGHIVASERAELLPGSGVNVEFFSPDSFVRAHPGHFLMISRVIADKGVREFVEAARRARQLFPHLRFTLMGQANVANRTAIPTDELQSWIAEGVIDYQQPLSDVRAAISAADFVVLPSYREGLSRVLLEAGAMGRPSITCDVPGCREVVEDGYNGLLCAPRDPGSLGDAVLKAAVISDACWSTMGRNARANVTERFSEELVIQAYLNALRRAGVEL